MILHTPHSPPHFPVRISVEIYSKINSTPDVTFARDSQIVLTLYVSQFNIQAAIGSIIRWYTIALYFFLNLEEETK